MPDRPTFVCLTDVPTPYRIHLFEEMATQLARRGIGFRALFMAWTVPTRSWKFAPETWKFDHRVMRGLKLQFGAVNWHLNPAIAPLLSSGAPRWLLVGGAWHLPTVQLALLVQSLRARAITIFWAEANVASTRVHSGPAALLRRLTLARADALAVPGKIAERTIRENWMVPRVPFIRLPNVVNEHVFNDRVRAAAQRREDIRAELKLSPSDVVLLWPARLHEPTKGVLNFLRAVGPTMPSDVRIVLAGTGPDAKTISAWQEANDASWLRMLGWVPEDRMVELYAAADALLLPSLRDPNPLSVIEALWSGLPLVISNRCGNWPEAVVDNGWVVDPDSPESMRNAIGAIAATGSARLRAMGCVSKQIAEREFSTVRVVENFLAGVGV